MITYTVVANDMVVSAMMKMAHSLQTIYLVVNGMLLISVVTTMHVPVLIS